MSYNESNKPHDQKTVDAPRLPEYHTKESSRFPRPRTGFTPRGGRRGAVVFSDSPDPLVGRCGATVITTGVSDIGVVVYSTLSSYVVVPSDGSTGGGGGMVGKALNAATPFHGYPSRGSANDGGSDRVSSDKESETRSVGN